MGTWFPEWQRGAWTGRRFACRGIERRAQRGYGGGSPAFTARNALKDAPAGITDPVSVPEDGWSAGAAALLALERGESLGGRLSPGRASPSPPGEESASRASARVGSASDCRSKDQFRGHPQPALAAATRQLPAEVQRRGDNSKSRARPGSSRVGEMGRVRQTELLRPEL